MKQQRIKVPAGKIKIGGIKCPCCIDVPKKHAKRYYNRLVRKDAQAQIKGELNDST